MTLLCIESAVKHIAEGRLIGYPTEAVYGIGCDPQNQAALESVLSLKSRDSDKGFILIAASQSQLAPYIDDVSEAQQHQLDAAWPGPVTFVCRARPGLPPLLTGGRDTIAVRVSSHPVVVDLCIACGHALISTSANVSGKPAITRADELLAEFGAQRDGLVSLAGVVEGSLGTLASATPIYSLLTGEQLR